MSTTIPTPEQTAPNGTPDFSEADAPKPRARGSRIVNGIALVGAGALVTLGTVVAAGSVAQRQANDARTAGYNAQRVEHTAQDYVAGALAAAKTGEYVTDAWVPSNAVVGSNGDATVHVDTWNDTDNRAGTITVTVKAWKVTSAVHTRDSVAYPPASPTAIPTLTESTTP